MTHFCYYDIFTTNAYPLIYLVVSHYVSLIYIVCLMFIAKTLTYFQLDMILNWRYAT